MNQMTPMVVSPVNLVGNCVRLEPLRMEHLPELLNVGMDPELWRWIPTAVRVEEDMKNYVLTALNEQKCGVSLPFVIMEQATGAVIGSTRYGNIDCKNRRLEIGWTWLTPSRQRSGANTEAKYLMLTHAFETLGTIRVEFKTDVLNQKSKNALLRIGALEEGLFRNHFITSTGRIRDSLYFSIINGDWPETKEKLRAKMKPQMAAV